MSKQAIILGKIVALKRQSAEQHLRGVQNEAERMSATLYALQESLRSLDEIKAGFDAHRLSEENGHVLKLLADIRRGEAALALKRTELHAARETLKRVVHSEERLGQTRPKG